MNKLDLKQQLQYLYQPSPKLPVIVDVPLMQFVAIEGAIEPGMSPGVSPLFQEAIQALYGISYALKFAAKKSVVAPVDYTVSALEALWWIEGGEFDINRPDNWHWRAMIMQPDVITEAMFHDMLTDLRKKKPSPGLERLQFGAFQEGLCVQIMHIGPFAQEPATVERMHSFARENGYMLRGMHHEIYLSDFRRADPAKMKTVLRHPVEAKAPAQA